MSGTLLGKVNDEEEGHVHEAVAQVAFSALRVGGPESAPQVGDHAFQGGVVEDRVFDHCTRDTQRLTS